MTTMDSGTTAAADAPSTQGFRSRLRCEWHPDAETGRPVMRWVETLELWPPDDTPVG